MIIAIDGLDGVGKTTIAALLRSTLNGCKILHCPPRSYFDDNVEILRDLGSYARAALFASGVLSVSELLKGRPSGKYIIIDRYIGSVFGMNQHLMPEFGEACYQLSLVRADLTIELTCSEEVRGQRLLNRGRPLDPFERLLTESCTLRDTVRESIRRTSSDFVEIDTTRLSPSVVTTLCTYHIDRCSPSIGRRRLIDDATMASLVHQMLGSGLTEREVVTQLESCGLGAPIERLARLISHRMILGDTHSASDGTVERTSDLRPYTAPPPPMSAATPFDTSSTGLLSAVKGEIRRTLGGGYDESFNQHPRLYTALGDLELALSGQTLESSRLNQMLSILEPLLTSSYGMQLRAELVTLVARLV